MATPTADISLLPVLAVMGENLVLNMESQALPAPCTTAPPRR